MVRVWSLSFNVLAHLTIFVTSTVDNNKMNCTSLPDPSEHTRNTGTSLVFYKNRTDLLGIPRIVYLFGIIKGVILVFLPSETKCYEHADDAGIWRSELFRNVHSFRLNE